MNDTIVLAYSGGLDTSVALRWLADQYDADVIACWSTSARASTPRRSRPARSRPAPATSR